MIKIHLEGQTYGRLFVMYDFEKEIGKSKKRICTYVIVNAYVVMR